MKLRDRFAVSAKTGKTCKDTNWNLEYSAKVA